MCSLNKRVRLINVFYGYIFVFHLNICVALVGHRSMATWREYLQYFPAKLDAAVNEL
jgi:hypothetical protein